MKEFKSLQIKEDQGITKVKIPAITIYNIEDILNEVIDYLYYVNLIDAVANVYTPTNFYTCLLNWRGDVKSNNGVSYFHGLRILRDNHLEADHLYFSPRKDFQMYLIDPVYREDEYLRDMVEEGVKNQVMKDKTVLTALMDGGLENLKISLCEKDGELSFDSVVPWHYNLKYQIEYYKKDPVELEVNMEEAQQKIKSLFQDVDVMSIKVLQDVYSPVYLLDRS